MCTCVSQSVCPQVIRLPLLVLFQSKCVKRVGVRVCVCVCVCVCVSFGGMCVSVSSHWLNYSGLANRADKTMSDP